MCNAIRIKSTSREFKRSNQYHEGMRGRGRELSNMELNFLPSVHLLIIPSYLSSFLFISFPSYLLFFCLLSFTTSISCFHSSLFFLCLIILLCFHDISYTTFFLSYSDLFLPAHCSCSTWSHSMTHLLWMLRTRVDS